jgi:hypothetical protein
MDDRETTGIRVAGKVHRLTGIGFQVWLALARLNCSGPHGSKSMRPASLQQLVNVLEQNDRIVSWQTRYDTARFYVWQLKKKGLVKEADSDATTRG